MVVEVTRKAYLASLVPVIVDAILNEHQVVADIVAFVPRGDFPRSRLGERQRGKILASWVTRKLRTIAQFSIRDPETAADQFPDIPQHRVSRASKTGSIAGNSTRRDTMIQENETRSQVPVTPEGRVDVPPTATTQAPNYGDFQEQSMPSEFDQFGAPVYQDPSAPGVPMIAEIPLRQDSLANAQVINRFDENSSSEPDFLQHGDPETAHQPSEMSAASSAGELAHHPSLGHDSYPSRQPSSSGSWRAQSFTHTMTSQSSFQPDATGEWPQESVMYHAQQPSNF